MPTLQERVAELVELFDEFDDPMMRYEHLIDMGKALPPLEPASRTEENRIHGCQSQVWVVSERDHEALHFRADADALIPKGLAAVLVHVFSGLPPAEIAHANLDFLERLGLRDHLSPTRKNGLAAMVKRLQREATACLS